MSKQKKVVVTTKKSTSTQRKTTPTTSRIKSASKNKGAVSSQLIFDKSNYLWMFVGFVCVVLGLLLMSGGRMADPNTWDPDVIYSFRRTGIAPIMILAGLGIEIYAIFKK